MSDSTKNIIKTLLIVIATALITYFGQQYLPGYEERIDKDSIVTTTIKKTFVDEKIEAYLKAKLKFELLDSLKGTIKPKLITVYKDNNYNLDSIIAEAKREALASIPQSDQPYVFISEADTTYLVKDSLGRTRDSVKVASKFTSPIPLHSASQHYFGIYHKSFNYDEHTEKKVNTTITVTRRTFWDNIKPGLMAAYGYAVKNAVWDFFIGAGANIDIEGLIETLQGE